MSTTTRELEAELFGREIRFEYSEHWVGYSLVLLRVVMGWVLLQGGITKLVTYLDGNPENNWAAAGFLLHAIPQGNPFVGVWTAMAGNPLVDILVMWGLTLTGLGLLLGAFVRLSAFWGAVMMLVFYAALLFGLGAFGAGRILGLDAHIEELEIVQNNEWLRLLLG